MRRTIVLSALLTLAGTASGQTRPALPPDVDLTPRFREMGLAPCAQGRRDTCSLFAVAGAANYEWARSDPAKAAPLATEFLVWAAKEACAKSHDQAMFYEAVAGLNAFGLCREALMPYTTKAGENLKPSEEAVRDARALRNRWNAHWIRLWEVRRPMTDAQLAAIQGALAEGHPVACGLRWPKSGGDEQLIKPPAAEDVRDGHSILLVGYQDDASQPGGGLFRFRNSSGPRWGNQGYGLMSYAYVRSYANDALWLELLPPDGEVPLQRFEAEDLPIAEKSRCEATPRATDRWSEKLWSNGKHLDCTAETGGHVTLDFDVRTEGTYRLRLLATAAPDYGKVRVAVDGKDVPEVFDLRSGRVCPGGSLELGTQTLTAGKHTLKLTAAGSGNRRGGWSFGIDALDLLRAKP